MRILQTLLLLYLRRYPNRLRLSQFNFLSQYAWLKTVLAELKPALFPAVDDDEPPADKEEIEHPDDEVIQILSSEIQGRRGRYRVDRWRSHRGQGYLFEGIQLGTDRSVVIKEYLLNPRLFNERELRHRQDTFTKVAGLTLADGRIQDLRVICPLEAIADTHSSRRCYLITDGRDASTTLHQHLKKVGAFSSETVRQLLLQLLQTLELLHQQKFRLPSGKTQMGIVHGNLSLESILWVECSNEPYLYLTDLELWEQWFDESISSSSSSPNSSPRSSAKSPGTSLLSTPDSSTSDSRSQSGAIASQTPQYQQDLTAAGHIGFALLMGTPDHGADPKDDTIWNPIHPQLKTALRQLMGIMPPFSSATEARQALLAIQPSPPAQLLPDSTHDTEHRQQQRQRWLIALVLLTGVVFLVGLLWNLLKQSPSTARSQSLRPCCLEDIDAVPSGPFIYTAVENGSWAYLLEQDNLGRRGWTLIDHLRLAYPNMELIYQAAPSIEAAIAHVQSGKADFAIIPQVGPLPFDLNRQPIAYDGLAVFVAFSYARRNQGLPTALDGTLALETVQKLYQGNITNWQEVGGGRLPVQLYGPTNPEAIAIFEQLALRGFQLGEWEPVDIQPANIIDMLRGIIRDFERPHTDGPIGGIGFGPISQIFGQCSVYPLAIDADPKDDQPAIQPFILDTGESIHPSTDLCDRKGTYHPNIPLFQTGTYPLSYPLVVIFPRDNSRLPIGDKFVEAMTTVEGQKLLSEGGLVPLEDIDESISNTR